LRGESAPARRLAETVGGHELTLPGFLRLVERLVGALEERRPVVVLAKLGDPGREVQSLERTVGRAPTANCTRR